MASAPTHAILIPYAPAQLKLSFADRPITGIGVDVVLSGFLVILAGIIRWPYLLLSPQFSSGGSAIEMALDIADGRAFYLREVSPYIGTTYIWLLAAVYRVFGPSVEATMLLTWTLGTLTIVPTYLLGREVGGRVVGGIAALLLATSAAHTVISSHVPISHSLTPLIATTVLWLVALAARRTDGDVTRNVALLAPAGFLTGVALQTHPTIAPLLVGAALGSVVMHRHWLRTRWPAIALACAILGYSTLLVYHVTSGFEIVTDIREKQGRYVDVGHGVREVPLTELYPENLGSLLLSTVRLLSGVLDDRDATSDYLTDPWVLAPAGLALIGMVVAVRRRALWIVVALIVAVSVPPAFSGKYRPILDGRFLMPLMPVLVVTIGLTVAGAARAIQGTRAWTNGPASAVHRLARRGALAALVLGTLLIAGRSLVLLDTFYENSLEDGLSNIVYLDAVADLEVARRGDEAVLLDPLLAQVKTAGGGKASTSLSWLLAVSRIPSQSLDEPVDPSTSIGRLAILHRTTADRLKHVVSLESVAGKRAAGRDRPSYRAYRINVAEAVRP